ncbi:MAG: penicillin-binding protein 1A [Polaribacter sp.]|jgi:penicillin-binding protein 1A
MENTESDNIDSAKVIRERRKPTYRKVVKRLWWLTIAGVLSVILMFVFFSFQDLPTFEELENPKSNLATEIYAANGEVLGRYYVENRIPVSYEELSPYLVQALVATEDERFYQHSGIDGEALLRVFGKTFLMGQKSAGGASTVTQQLAKMLFTKRAGSGLQRVVQKFKEWIIAVKLERSYTKEEIIAMYLNKFSFLYDAYGIKAASEIYFAKGQDSLSIEEAAVLVGMLKNPSLFNPIRRPDTTEHRRMVVLYQMKNNGMISQIEYDSLRQLPLDMSNFNRKTHADGPAPYFRIRLGETIKEILGREENRKPDGTKYDIYRDGLKVYTTLDPVIQKHAEDAMMEHMQKLQQTFWKHWKGKDPWTFEDPNWESEEIELQNSSRKRAMERTIKRTDRYAAIRKKYLTEITEKIQTDKNGLKNLRDIDIERMLREEKSKGVIAKLVSQKYVGNRLAIQYRRLMKSENWKDLKSEWRKFKKAVETGFNEPVKMRVFAYNDRMEKDTVLSPIDSIKYHSMFLQLGSVAIDPSTGHVKSWVGGINHKYFQYDHVTSDRQVGSTFKPFIYATVLAHQGISPCFRVYDLPYTIHKGEGNFGLLQDWTPNNANGKYSGQPYTLFRGLAHSKNTVSVFLMKQLGDTEYVRGLVSKMGLDSSVVRSNGQYRIPKQPSICLGASDLTVLELTGAYTTFANNGRNNKPIFITRITDKNGRDIYREIPEGRIALHPNTNYVMVNMLKRVVSQGLPGFNKIKSELGGKTGTTNDYVDGWFMGLSADLVVGTWVGGDDRWIRFRDLRYGIGARMARPFFAKFLTKLEADPTSGYDAKKRFNVPSGDLGIVIDCDEYDYGGGLSPQEEVDGGPAEEDEGFGNSDFDRGEPATNTDGGDQEDEDF